MDYRTFWVNNGQLRTSLNDIFIFKPLANHAGVPFAVCIYVCMYVCMLVLLLEISYAIVMSWKFML